MEYFLNDNSLEEEDTLANKYLFFSVDKEVYGIEIKYVTEIIGMQDITHVPQMPEFIKGIINLRGSIIPVADLRIRFKKEMMDYTGRTSIIIISFGDVILGLIVDKAIEVGIIMQEEILPPPEIAAGYHNRFVSGVAENKDKIRLLIDCEKLVSYEEIEVINQAKEQ